MPTKFFVPSDFDIDPIKQYSHYICNLVNSKLDKCERVYCGTLGPYHGATLWTYFNPDDTYNHSALLVDVQPLEKKCEHNSVQIVEYSSNQVCRYKCGSCGVELQPTGWMEIE